MYEFENKLISTNYFDRAIALLFHSLKYECINKKCSRFKWVGFYEKVIINTNIAENYFNDLTLCRSFIRLRPTHIAFTSIIDKRKKKKMRINA